MWRFLVWSFISLLAVSLQKEQQGTVRLFPQWTVGEWIQFGSAVIGLGGKFSAQWSCVHVCRQGISLWMLIWCSSPFHSATRGWKSYVSCFSQSISAFSPCLSGLFKYRSKKNHQDLKKKINWIYLNVSRGTPAVGKEVGEVPIYIETNLPCYPILLMILLSILMFKIGVHKSSSL